MYIMFWKKITSIKAKRRTNWNHFEAKSIRVEKIDMGKMFITCHNKYRKFMGIISDQFFLKRGQAGPNLLNKVNAAP